MDESSLVGREYLRVSRDRSGVGSSPDQQHDENEAELARRGWALHPSPYRDEGSASRYARREREGFRQLRDDLVNGRFEADVLVLWESSRGSRTVGEWASLIDLCAQLEVRFFVTTHGRLYDPTNARDRRSLQEDAVDSEYESAKTSARLLRHTAAAAKAGKAHGKNLWGYRRVYDQETRRLLRIEPDPTTGPLVEEAARRFLAGETCYGIAKDWNSRGISPRRETHTEHRRSLGWTPEAVRDILRKPSYAGIRTHNGKVVSAATWPALISRGDWERIQTVLKQRARPTDFGVRHLLSGIARCAVCGAPLFVGRQYSGRRLDASGQRQQRSTYLTYTCRGAPGRTGFHVSIKQDHLDLAVTEAALARMERPDFLALIGQRDQGVDEGRARLLDEIARHRSYLEETRARAAAEQRLDLLFDQEARLSPVIHALEAQLRSLAEVDPIVVQLAQSTGIRDRWGLLPVAEQRKIVRALVVPTIHRARRPGTKGIDLNRIELIWK